MERKKDIAGLILSKRGKSDVEINPEVKPMSDDIDPGLVEACEDILRAINDKSPLQLAHSIMSAFQICDAMPHEEGEHLNIEEGEEDAANEW